MNTIYICDYNDNADPFAVVAESWYQAIEEIKAHLLDQIGGRCDGIEINCAGVVNMRWSDKPDDAGDEWAEDTFIITAYPQKQVIGLDALIEKRARELNQENTRMRGVWYE